jgi:leader peptidase (prepilin peptidase) / N-methyltransferase
MTIADLYSTEPAWLIGSVFLLSLLVGSFLNVVVHRLPIMMERDWKTQAEELLSRSVFNPTSSASDIGLKPDLQEAASPRYNLVVPRSACPHCGAQITAAQNIPVISWLLLKGHCANCKATISARYPLIELLTAMLSALVAWRFGFTWHMGAALIFTWLLIAMCLIDFDHQLLPDSLTLPLLWLGLLFSTGTNIVSTNPAQSIVGAAIGYFVLWSVYHLFKLLTGKEGMGYGDFKLLAALGAWMGWSMLPLIVLLSACSGAVIGIALIVIRGRDRNIPIPFGPYLGIAGFIALLWGDEIVTAYLNTLTH